ncbi:hypothetical protein CerSpe_015910 [Prunus speciosa]
MGVAGSAAQASYGVNPYQSGQMMGLSPTGSVGLMQSPTQPVGPPASSQLCTTPTSLSAHPPATTTATTATTPKFLGRTVSRN